jgi:hypothetical protein
MKQLILLDICTADYFRGHSLPVISVPVHSETTVGELIEGIEDEYDYCFDLYENQYSEADFESAIAELREKNKDILELPFLLDADAEEEEDESEGEGVYAYFVLGKIRSATFSGIRCNFAE